MANRIIIIVVFAVILGILALAQFRGVNNTDNITSPVQTQSVENQTEIESIAIEIYDGSFNLQNINLERGKTYQVTVSNKGNLAHSFQSELLTTDRLEPGESTTISITPALAGTFPFRCTVPCAEFHMDMQTGYNLIVA